MAWFQNGNARIYYEDVGQGKPIVSNHGLAEDCGYWRDTGVTAKLAEKYRVISMDMRGHGQTVIESEPFGYDADTMGNDFGALADYLGLNKFHMLTHATGGMAGVRYAMTHSDRLLSLMLTDTGSATQPKMPGIETDEDRQKWLENAERRPIENPTPEQRKAMWRANPGPFTFKMAEHPDSDKMWEVMDGFYQRRVSREALANFMISFYSDPDPRVEGLRNIGCPTLVLLGEHDIVFIEPSEIMVKEIPNSTHVVIEDVGHMTAIECPERTAQELLSFLETVSGSK